MAEYFQLRFTPLLMDPSLNPSHCLEVFHQLIKTYNLTEYALCFEKQNKYLEPTHHHFHFNFQCFKKKETIRTQFLRICDNELGKHPKGNTQYMLQCLAEPDDIERWWRYIFKENPILKLCKSFTEKEIEEMTLVARDERKRAAKHWLAKRDTKEERQTMFQRYSAEIKKQDIIMNYKNVWLAFLKLYMENDNAINPKTLQGYTHLFLLKEKIITPEEFYYDLEHKHYH